MTRLVALSTAILLAAAPLQADGTDTLRPNPETIQRQTMGGSFPVSTVVTLTVLAIVAAAISADN